MNRGVLGTGPDANKRKRPDAQAAYISSMMHGNPKLLLSESPLFEGLTQHQLPFTVYNHKAPPDVQYQARIRLAFPDGTESFGIGVARTKKESERVAAIDACQQLQERGLLVRIKKSSAASVGWGDNPKNTLVTSVAFRDVCCGGNARALPITLRSSGPDHAKAFVAELTVPLRNRGEVFIAVGQGPNKAEAERACCTAACEKLHDVGLLQKPNEKGANPPSTTLTTPSKAMLNHQQNELPAILSLRNEELSMMEDALQRLHFDNVRLEMGERDASVDLQRRSSHTSNGISIPKEQLGTENAIMRLEARKRSLSPEFAEQRRARQSLPAWRERQNVVDAVSNHRVVVLTGETGCGKTTQVPQYMLEEAELQGSGAEVHIVVTQPRRIAAISVAERVAWERGESLGKSVGYAIRLDSCPPRARGSILYCTTGILLHRLQRADGLAGVSHVIIDEVHERDVDTDFLLVVIRELLNHNPALRVVVMSATLDASVFTRYFGGCPLVNIPGMTYSVKVYKLDDLPQLMGRNFLPPSRPAHGGSLDEEDVDVDLVVSVIIWVSQVFAQDDGAILCFLPGWDTISIVRDRLLKARASRFMMIVPLHSQLPAGEQRAAFARAPSGMRKVVLATNIAETSVTIDDIVYVVDSGKIKEKKYDVSRNLTTMRVQWTSQASARQRQGRAGRVQAGFCFQLYSQATFLSMLHHQIPEMQRVPLEELCLQIKAILSPSTEVAENAKAAEADTPEDCTLEESKVGGAGGIASFLSKAIQPPSVLSVHAAIQVLQQLGAIDQLENLTPLGKTLARLTVHPRFGKMLVYGALLGCLDPLLTIAAAACFRDPFVSPLNRREEADNIRASFGTGLSYGSDQLAFVNAFQQWKSAESDYRGHTFCEESFLVFVTMRLIAGMRTQFERTLWEAGLCEQAHVHSTTTNIMSEHLARSLLAASLYPNIVRSELFRESKGMRTATKHAYRWRLGLRGQSGRVFLHPTSVLSEKNLSSSLSYYLVFQEKVQTSQVFIRGCTLLPPLAMVLLGWNVTVSMDDISSAGSSTPTPGNGDWMLLRVEGWLNFFIDHRAGLLLLQLRHAFDLVIARWVSGHVRTESERQVVECVVALLQGSCHDMLAQSAVLSNVATDPPGS